MKNFFLIFLAIIILSGCGYNSVYKQNEKTNFEISSLEIKGDTAINNLIEKELNKYVGNDKEKKFEIYIKTDYSKNPISKDKTGKITKYKLTVDLNLKFKINDQDKNVNLSETFYMKNFDDKFEEKKYEKQIKNNLSSLMLNNIMSYLINFE